MSKPEILKAYRRFLRAGLRAVQYSQPSRSTFLELARAGFRDPEGTFDGERIRRTVWFFNDAANGHGIARQILKNICRVHWDRTREERKMPWRVRCKEEEAMSAKKRRLMEADVIKGTEFDHYERTIAMLNDSMGLCLK
ncbi:hypothetical protein VTK56DRAFT_4486 [Thermocarpiscus australiensis]